MPKNLPIQLAGRPTEPVEESTFNIAESYTPELRDGESDRRDQCLTTDPGRFHGQVPKVSPARRY
jgi:hypothetical protein